MVKVRRLSREYSYLVLLVLVSVWVFLVGLGVPPLHVFDEGIYASISRHILESGNWLIPHSFHPGRGSVQYRPWLEKPPLVLWLQALSMSLLGTTEFAVRLPSALAAIATTAVVYVFGRDLAGKRTGLFAGVVYLTMPYVYAGNNAARTGGTDPVFILFGTVFVYYMWRVATGRETSSLEPYYAAAAAVLAWLAKGAAAGIFVIVLVPLVLLQWRTFTTKRPLTAGLAGVAAALVWPVIAYFRHPEIFIEVFIRGQVLARMTGKRGAADPAALFDFMQIPYFRYLPDMTDPWVYFGIFAVALVLFRLLSEIGMVVEIEHVRTRTMDLLFVSWWFGAIIIFFAVTGNHRWYLLPAFVPLALVVGWMLTGTSRGRHASTIGTGLGAVLTAILSARVAWPSPINQQLNMGPGAPIVQGWVFTLAVGGFLFLIVLVGQLSRYSWIHNRVHTVTTDGGLGRLAVPRESYDQVRRGCLVVGALGLVMVISAPAVYDVTSGSATQAEFGQAVDERALPNATIYLDSHATHRTPFYPFRYYAARAVAEEDQLLTARGTVSEPALLVLTAANVRDLQCPQDSQYHVLARGVNRPGTKIALVEVDRGCHYEGQ